MGELENMCVYLQQRACILNTERITNQKEKDSPIEKWARYSHRHFPKEDFQMTNQCSTSLVIRETEIKAIMRHLPEWLKLIGQVNTKCWWENRTTGSLIHCWWGCTYNHFEGWLGTIFKHAHPGPSTSASQLSLTPPAAHLAVHDGRALEVCKEIFHLVEGLAILLHRAIVGWYERPQRVAHQMLQATLLTLTKTLKNPAILSCLEVP